MQQKVWDYERRIKPWKPGLFSSLVYILRAALRGGPLLFLLHLCMAETMRVQSSAEWNFSFYDPFWKVTWHLYMWSLWLLTSSCPARRLMMPGDSRPENWRVVKVLLAFCCSRTLCVIIAWLFHLFFLFTLFSWAAFAAFTRFTYLQPHFTQKTKMDFTPRPGSSINWSEGNGDSRGGLPLRWGALFASTLLHST